jgi:hypothetical protein
MSDDFVSVGCSIFNVRIGLEGYANRWSTMFLNVESISTHNFH